MTTHYDDVVDALEIFSADPLILRPEERFSYSSHGYNLISAVIQEASGRKFLEIVRNEVWAPLNLTETVADHTDYVIQNRAAAYTRRASGQIRNAPFVDNSYKWAGGGFLSTPSDLVRFGFGVFGEGGRDSIVSPQTLELLLTPPTMSDGVVADQPYGLGWFSYDERSWFGHGGGSVGGNTLFQVHPDQAVVVAIACNLSACLAGIPKLGEIRTLFLRAGGN